MASSSSLTSSLHSRWETVVVDADHLSLYTCTPNILKMTPSRYLHYNRRNESCLLRSIIHPSPVGHLFASGVILRDRSLWCSAGVAELHVCVLNCIGSKYGLIPNSEMYDLVYSTSLL